jgi:hypothetical protein
MGDFNIDLLKSESCDYSIRFLEQLYTSSYIPLVLRPTRITQHTATLIDNIFTKKTSKTECICKRIINDANVQSFTNTIKNISWENVLSENNTTESYNKFFDLFSTSYEKNFPLTKTVTKRKIDKNRSP